MTTIEEGEMTTMDWSAQAGSGPSTYQEFLVPAMFEPLAQHVTAAVGVKPGEAVLDVACGTGAASRAAARAAGPDGSVTGVDLGEPTLEIARSFAPEPDAAPISFSQSDAAALPVEDAAFDVVMCQQGLQFFPERPAALAEMHRALKPGGRLAVSTWASIDRTPFAPIAEALGRHLGEEAQGGMSSPFALTSSDLEELVGGAGFEDIALSEVTFDGHWPCPPGDFARMAIASGPLAAMFAAAPAAAQQAVGADVGEALTGAATPDGMVHTITSNLVLARR